MNILYQFSHKLLEIDTQKIHFLKKENNAVNFFMLF